MVYAKWIKILHSTKQRISCHRMAASGGHRILRRLLVAGFGMRHINGIDDGTGGNGYGTDAIRDQKGAC